MQIPVPARLEPLMPAKPHMEPIRQEHLTLQRPSMMPLLQLEEASVMPHRRINMTIAFYLIAENE